MIKRGILIIILILAVSSVLAYRSPVSGTFTTQANPPRLNHIDNITYHLYPIGIPLNQPINATDLDLPSDNLIFFSNSSLQEFQISTIGYVPPSPPIEAFYLGQIFLLTTNKSLAGIYLINISVKDQYDFMDSQIIQLNISLDNLPPNITEFNPNDTNIAMNEGTGLLFNITAIDPNLDVLTYQWFFDTFPIPFAESDNFFYVADFNSAGYHNLTAIVYDPYNLEDEQSWNLTIIDVPSGGSGGGGGGGGGGNPGCLSNWSCSEWSLCPVYEIQIRTCIDTKKCDTERNHPLEKRSCDYNPPATCNDGQLNNGEVLIDCGGPCGPCATCSDKIKNQDEEGIDCGGSCARQCGLIYTPALYPVCGDAKCEGVDILFCPNECKSTWPIIIIILLLIAFYILYGSRKVKYILVTIARSKEERSLLERKKAPAIIALNRLETLKKIITKENTETITKRFNETVKEFFSSYLKIKYAFTYDELIKELKEQEINLTLQRRIGFIFENMTKFEYGKYKIKESEIKTLIKKTKRIIDDLVRIDEKRILKETKENKANKKSIISSIESKFEEAKTIQKQQEIINKQIINIKYLISKNRKDEAKDQYLTLKEIYSKLPTNLKQKYRKNIVLIYEKIKP